MKEMIAMQVSTRRCLHRNSLRVEQFFTNFSNASWSGQGITDSVTAGVAIMLSTKLVFPLHRLSRYVKVKISTHSPHTEFVHSKQGG